ncbi:MAG: undecaprenyl-diphosphate phosphatase [Treponema porcinum]|uniref:undecaprenyl-diphosphate phosphatase n=1 Tax=Treponema porcinum TaxID=261392 RepID=UPI00235308E3|nr:undecaprenyl-diphosphate phosphatase [Treponema porcinum]MCI6815907.1 undecaprenyl-diphosphate phosphatase [Treponema porcinum]MDY5049562.1 undecaprenyl-diphosphate phosphatase [Treponema porcinum]
MTVIQGILLGILQGIAEFLPISSSGHLAVVQKLFGLEEVPLLFDIMLHLATLLAVVLYFRKKIWTLLCVFGRLIARRPAPKAVNKDDLLCGTEARGRMTILAVIITTVVTGAIGVFTSKLIPDMPVKVTCAGFIVTAILLVFSSIIERRNSSAVKNSAEKNDGIKWYQAIVIGVMQGIGTLPGISRSGSTIAGSQLCGVNRAAAGEYSFIVSIPAILGAFLLELKDFAEVGSTVGAAPVIAGCAAAFAWGYISLAVLMKIIRKGKLEWFACYLIPAGILGILFL